MEATFEETRVMEEPSSTVEPPLQTAVPRSTSVASCYVFKSRLQEYAQKVGIPTPVYQTTKQGPSHVPVFKSTVIVNEVKYESLPGFFNRKEAEQSAAEIAIMELHKSGQMAEGIPTVHETGLCKNLLQEYAQKMNYAIPSYICNRQQPSGSDPFLCTVEIGGIRYIGAAARTRKEAEIKAARTALLAIQRSSETRENAGSQYTVLPCRKRCEQETKADTLQKLKPRKTNVKRKWPRKKYNRNKEMKSNKDETPNQVVKEEDASVDSCRDKDDLGSGGMKDAPPKDDTDMKAMAMETNGSLQGEQEGGSTILKCERFEEYRERERESEVTDSELRQGEVQKDVIVVEGEQVKCKDEVF